MGNCCSYKGIQKPNAISTPLYQNSPLLPTIDEHDAGGDDTHKSVADTDSFVVDEEKVMYPLELQENARLASEGNPEAQYSLGLAHDIGQYGLPLDSRRAIHWYTRAAQQNHVPAKHNLGILYGTGHNGIISKDVELAMKWLKSAAEAGNCESQFKFALLLAENLEFENVILFLTRAAKQKHSLSQAQLGTYFIEGKIVKKDEEKGINLLKKAAKCEDPVALYNLAVIYKTGLGTTPTDKSKMKAYFSIAKKAKSLDRFEALNQDFPGNEFIKYTKL
jgi:TPR repeat protein